MRPKAFLDRLRGRARGGHERPAPEPFEDWLARRPWEGFELPRRLRDAPSMLTVDERAMLHTLAEGHPFERGGIVDGGCFLGGSTLALAMGLGARTDGRRPRIHTFDRFELDWGSLSAYPMMLEGLEVGDSFRDRFELVVGEELELVDVHAGDVLEERWPGDPIELLFVDIAKSWEISDHVHGQWLPHLAEGTGVLVEQDYVHEWCPWLHILLEHLADHFAYVAAVGGNSAVFRCVRAVPAAAVPEELRTLAGADDMLALFDRSASRFSGEDRGIVESARAVLLRELGRHDEAQRQLATVAEHWGDAGPRMQPAIASVGSFVQP